ncbi:thioredoxin domain-containing protein 16-like [Lineus longissimus]|uniref:thioredoxin domain-containing protein 16-like n=1 Tax=Lineus longissimus TaxID=88925 RepID=UPI002B4E9E09
MLFFDMLFSFLLIHIASGTVLEKNKLKHVTFLDESNFDTFIQHPNIRAVVFYEPFPDSTGEQESIYQGEYKNVKYNHFLPLYQNASKYISKFEVDTGLVDCAKTPSVGKCGELDANNVFVYGYRNSKMVLKLSYENLFNEDAQIGSFLHLNAFKRLPIINNAQKMDDRILAENRGKANVLFGYFQYLGDPEHRAFVEAAYPHLNDFAFVMITDKDTFEKARFYVPLEAQERSKVYVFLCKERKEGEECPHVIYRGSLDKDNITIYMNNLNEASKTFDIPRDGNHDVLKHLKIHVAYLFYDKQSKEMVKQTAEKLRNTFPGVVGVLTVDTDHPDLIKSTEEIKKPGFAIKRRGNENPIHMEHKFSEANVIQYTRKQIEEYQAVVRAETDEIKDPFQVMDDEVATPVYNLNLLPQTTIPIDHITALTDKTFSLITSRDVPTLVVFYTKYDTASMAFLRSYSGAVMAEKNRTSFTRVNCFDWTDVCTAQKVAHFPSIRLYQSGREPIIYRGMLDGEAVINFVKVVQMGSPLEITCPEKAKSFMSGSYPEGLQGLKMDATIAVGLSNAADISVVKKVADSFGGDVFFAYGTGDVANVICDGMTPCLIVLLPNEPKKIVKIDGILNAKKLTDDIQAYRLPTLVELTVASLPKIYARKKPMVMYFGDDTDAEYKALALLAGSGYASDHIFTWVNCIEFGSIGLSVLHTYQPKASVPAIALLNLNMGNVFMPEKLKFTVEGIKDWMMSVASGKEAPVYVMPDTKWKPLSEGYDFIEKMRTKAEKEPKEEEVPDGGRLRGVKTDNKRKAPVDKVKGKATEDMIKKSGMDKTSSLHEEL